MLICPICHETLKKEEKRYCCKKKHSFDIAKQGYTNLYLKSSNKSGDNKEMVQARTDFLNEGFYKPLKDAIVSWIQELGVSSIVDAGCGEGYYTNTIEEETKTTIYAFDLSKEALKYASRQNKNVYYFLNSIYELPIENNSCDLVLNIFAPFAKEEFSRILKKDGYILKVDPEKDHLWEMKEVLYENILENDALNENYENLSLIDTRKVSFMMDLDKDDIAHLFTMTPYLYKTKKESRDKLLALNELKCRLSLHFISI